MRLAAMMLASAFALGGLRVNERATVSGKVVDRSGHPIAHATVLVYHAGVKRGYSTFCPSCYADCGKRAITDSDGTFVLSGLDPELWFELLAVGHGFQPAFIKKVDPLKDPTPTAVLASRLAADIPEKVVRGRVVDTQGLPLHDVVVEPVGISTNELPDGRPRKGEVSMYGEIEGLEPIAISNRTGEFEIASQKPASGMLLKIDARGFAPKLQAISTGMGRKTITVSEGAIVRGRLLHHGMPVTGAEIGLIPRNRGGFGGNLKIIGDPYEEVRVGTQADGSFVLADLPTPVDWYIYAKMGSLPKGLATHPVACATKRGGEIINVGDLQLQLGHRVRGKVILGNGASIPDGMRVIVSSDEAWDSQVALLRSGGGFEFAGLPTGSYDISAAVRGYKSAREIRQMPIDHNIDDLTIVLEPESRP